MIYPLPADTVFEARRRAKFRTWLLFVLLTVIYLCGVILIAAICFGFESYESYSRQPAFRLDPATLLGFCAAAFIVAGLHFIWARSKSLENILKHLGCRPIDLSDQAHKRFADLVEEASLAIGSPGIQAVVIPTSAINAFSVEAAGGKRAIGATEGILARLTRPELESVVAHEAAHLAHGDSRLLSTACSLFSVFDWISRLRVQSRGRASGPAVLIWIVAVLGRFLSQLVYMAISRNREYYADSEAVHMCKNPLALADALNKISSRDRGYMAVPEGFSAMFIMNPVLQARDEMEGLSADLLSTHPPVKSRIEKLMEWAKQSAGGLRRSETSNPGSDPIFLHDQGNNWTGPVSPSSIQPGQIDPGTWVAVGKEIYPAAALPVLQGAFGGWPQGQGAAGTHLACPRCTTPLLDEMYEGIAIHRCSWCGGRLLPQDSITRMIVRRQAAFDSALIADTFKWRPMQTGSLKELCLLPHIACPVCKKPMFKRIYTEVTRVVIDVCSGAECGVIWCDPMELERIQILIESIEKQNTQGPA